MSFYSDVAPALVIVSLSLSLYSFISGVRTFVFLCVFLVFSNKLRSLIDQSSQRLDTGIRAPVAMGEFTLPFAVGGPRTHYGLVPR